MPYKHRRVCPICGKPNLLNLSGHLRQVHGLWNEDKRVPWLRQALHSPPMPTQAQSLSQLPIIIPPEDVHLQQLPVTKVYTSTTPPSKQSVIVNRKRPASGKRVLTKKRKVLKKSSKRKVKRKLQSKSEKRVLAKKRKSSKPIKSKKNPRICDSSVEEEDEEIMNPKTKRELEQNWICWSEQEDTDSEEEGEEEVESDPEEDIENGGGGAMTVYEDDDEVDLAEPNRGTLHRLPCIPRGRYF